MSLPIPTTALIRGATRFAGEMANRVSQAIGFDDVLRGVDVDRDTDVTALREQLVQTVHTRLSQSGIAVNQPLQLRVTDDGSLQVEGNHPQAAEIEALLSSDQVLAKTARNMVLAGGGPEIEIGPRSPSGPTGPSGLTPAGGEANILEAPGGYANW